MSSHTYDYLDDKPTADDLRRCSKFAILLIFFLKLAIGYSHPMAMQAQGAGLRVESPTRALTNLVACITAESFLTGWAVVTTATI